MFSKPVFSFRTVCLVLATFASFAYAKKEPKKPAPSSWKVVLESPINKRFAFCTDCKITNGEIHCDGCRAQYEEQQAP